MNKYMLFFLELKNLLDKYGLSINHKLYIFDESNHYTVDFIDADTISFYCFENEHEEILNLPEISEVHIEESEFFDYDDSEDFNPLEL